jgi:hypothetical protein
MKLLMGGETEYAISALDVRHRPIDQADLLEGFIEHAKRTLAYTSLTGRGRFLRNGNLIYLDAGLHIEVSTAECTSPFAVVRYLKAGDRLVLDLARSFQRTAKVGDVFCSRTNVDYVSATLWAAHESYMHRVHPDVLPDQLVPFLASRVIFGAGGWDYRSPGLRFTLSPRAHFITNVADRDSQYVRPLFHLKDEPLSGTGSHRLHVACAESLCSDTANVLRFGTTALVLAAIEKGARPGTDVTLMHPVRALQSMSLDASCRTRVSLLNGRRMTALEIQRHYLCVVQASLADCLPDWGGRVCDLWRSVLDLLEHGPARVGDTLDWAIKRRVFERHLARRGFDWASLRVWDAALTRVKRRWLEMYPKRPFCAAAILRERTALTDVVDRVSPVLARDGTFWSRLRELLSLRYELFELDAKFAALGEGGIFGALDASGALRHALPGAELDDALERPPEDTRAGVRGRVVGRLSDAGTRHTADWMRVSDLDNRMELDLSDPFETEERWHEAPRLDEKSVLACLRWQSSR